MRAHRTTLACLVVTWWMTCSCSWVHAQVPRSKMDVVLPEIKASEQVPGWRLAARRTAVVSLVDRVKGAVVNIHSERTVQGKPAPDLYALLPSQNRVNGMGTGIIIDARGYIVTNYHVVEEVNVLRVRLSDGTSQNALVIARSAENDLALLKIDAGRALPSMPLSTASDLMVGETVVAIGNAYGYEHTVSVGVVSAIKRDVTLNKDMSYKSLIQTDASINPGNSGGPLLNIHGELVGVNVAIRAGAQNIGFAITVDQMIRVVGDMFRARRRNTFDGLVCRDVIEQTPDGAVRAVVIERAEANSPAATAGLAKDDVLIQVGDVRVACSYDLERALLDHKPGDTVAVTFRRDGKEQPAKLALQTGERARPAAQDLVWRKLGLRLRHVEADQVSRVNAQLHGGLEVTAVNAEGPAGRAGVRRGDILIGLHQWETLSLDNVSYVLTHPDYARFSPLSFHILRAGQVRRGWMQPGE
jgi:serine protease Do